jgi:transmembrane sensor
MTASDQRSDLKREAHAWLVRLTSGDATTTDAAAAKAWCEQSPDHAQAFAEASVLWDSLGPVARDVADGASSVPRRLSRRALIGGGLAAAAATVVALAAARPPLGLWPSVADLMADYRTGTGDRRRVALADGISVELNTRTSLNVRLDGGTGQHIDLISGEAAIGTGGAIDKPLVVSAAGARVVATNATFDVRCDGAAASVICLQGAVTVDYRGEISTLAQGQQAWFGRPPAGSIEVKDPIAAVAWREGRLVFHGVPLAQVIDEVNRYRPGRIILMNETLGRHPVDATFPLSHIDEIVALVRNAYGAKTTTLPGGVVILS